MIYILGERYNKKTFVDSIIMSSSNIQDILNYLNLEYIDYKKMTTMDLVIMREGDNERHYLSVNKSMIDSFGKLHTFYLKDVHKKNQYDEVKEKIQKWCEKFQ